MTWGDWAALAVGAVLWCLLAVRARGILEWADERRRESEAEHVEDWDL